MTNDTGGEEFASFLSLSEYLTGEIRMDRGLAHSHFRRMQLASDAIATTKLLLHWREAQKNPSHTAEMVGNILADTVLGPLAKTLMLLWYTGGIKNAAGLWEIESAADYFGALAWKVVGSHPPGLSNQFYGHWKYPTEY
jgi:hypothetical protein